MNCDFPSYSKNTKTKIILPNHLKDHIQKNRKIALKLNNKSALINFELEAKKIEKFISYFNIPLSK